MPIRDAGPVADDAYKAHLKSILEGKGNEKKALFLDALKGIKLDVIPSDDPKATAPKGVIFTRYGEVLSNRERAELRIAISEGRREFMANLADLKDKDGKPLPITAFSFMKGIDFDGKPTEFNEQEIDAGFLSLFLNKDASNQGGPGFDNSATVADFKEERDAKQTMSAAGLVMNGALNQLDKFPEPPKPIKIEGSAFKAQELMQKNMLKMQFSGTNYGLVANTADGKMDDNLFLAMMASSKSVVAGGGSPTVISTAADFPAGQNVGPDGKPKDQAGWLTANPGANLDKAFVTQVLMRAGMEEVLPMVTARMAAAEAEKKAFTRASLREAVMGALHDNFKLANEGKDASDIEVLLASGAIGNDFNQAVPTAPAAPAPTAPTAPAPTAPTVPAAPTATQTQGSIPNLFPTSPTAPTAPTTASTMPASTDWAAIQALFAMINARNMQAAYGGVTAPVGYVNPGVNGNPQIGNMLPPIGTL